jgi:hypothetical protein
MYCLLKHFEIVAFPKEVIAKKKKGFSYMKFIKSFLKIK